MNSLMTSILFLSLLSFSSFIDEIRVDIIFRKGTVANSRLFTGDRTRIGDRHFKMSQPYPATEENE